MDEGVVDSNRWAVITKHRYGLKITICLKNTAGHAWTYVASIPIAERMLTVLGVDKENRIWRV